MDTLDRQETLDRLEREIAEGRADIAARQSRRMMEGEPDSAAVTDSTPKPAVMKARADTVTRAELRAHVRNALNDFADAVGDAIARFHKEHADEIATELRAEIAALRAEIAVLRQGREGWE